MPTVRGQTCMLSLSCNSLAMRSSPQVRILRGHLSDEFGAGLWAGEVCRTAVISSARADRIPGGASGGRYLAGRSPGRPATKTCDPASPSRAESNHGPGVASPSAWKSASCLRRNRFSAANARRDRVASTGTRARSNASDDSVVRLCVNVRKMEPGMNA